jgi:hypothetical protein
MRDEKQESAGSWAEAAELVLRRSNRPLHAYEIAERAITSGLVPSEGKTPHKNVQAAIWKDINKRRGGDSPFRMIGEGRAGRYYWLKGRPLPSGWSNRPRP